MVLYLRMLCQVFNRVQVEVLNPVLPEEGETPKEFASRVQSIVGAASKLPCLPIDYSLCRPYLENHSGDSPGFAVCPASPDPPSSRMPMEQPLGAMDNDMEPLSPQNSNTVVAPNSTAWAWEGPATAEVAGGKAGGKAEEEEAAGWGDWEWSGPTEVPREPKPPVSAEDEAETQALREQLQALKRQNSILKQMDEDEDEEDYGILDSRTVKQQLRGEPFPAMTRQLSLDLSAVAFDVTAASAPPAPAAPPVGNIQEEHRALTSKCFERVALDGSGTLATKDEVGQVLISVMFHLNVGQATREKLTYALDKEDIDGNAWDVDHFVRWYNGHGGYPSSGDMNVDPAIPQNGLENSLPQLATVGSEDIDADLASLENDLQFIDK